MLADNLELNPEECEADRFLKVKYNENPRYLSVLMLTQYSPCTKKQLVFFVLNYIFVIITPLLKINLHIGTLLYILSCKIKKELCEIRTIVVEVLYHILKICIWFRLGGVRHRLVPTFKHS